MNKKALFALGVVIAASQLSAGCQGNNGNYNNGYNNSNYNNGNGYNNSSNNSNYNNNGYNNNGYNKNNNGYNNSNNDYNNNNGYNNGYNNNGQPQVRPMDHGMPITNQRPINNPLNVERIKGQITDKKIVTNPDGSTSVVIMLTTDSEVVRVLLGPSQYLDQSRVALQLNDIVEVKGSRMKVNGEEMMIATEISKSGNTIELRDMNGNPLWRQQPVNNAYYNNGLKQH